MYARSRRQNKVRLNRMIEMQKNAHPILDESSGQGERFFCGMRKRGCKSASGILLHPLRQCIGGLLLLFFGGERRGAVTLLGAVACRNRRGSRLPESLRSYRQGCSDDFIG